jgi:hypothetical protein
MELSSRRATQNLAGWHTGKIIPIANHPGEFRVDLSKLLPIGVCQVISAIRELQIADGEAGG